MLATPRPPCRFPAVESLLPAKSSPSSLPSRPPPRPPIAPSVAIPPSSVASPSKYSLVFSTKCSVTFCNLRLPPLPFPIRPERGMLMNSAPGFNPPRGQLEWANFSQASKRLRKISKIFKRLGNQAFWLQLVLTVVAAIVLSFFKVVSGTMKSPIMFYAAASSLAAASISTFWSYGYKRLSDSLWKTASQPSQAPPYADVVKGLRNRLLLNLLGMIAAILGMLATSALSNYQSISPGQSLVVVYDILLVQATVIMIFSHFIGLVFSLELMNSVILESVPIHKLAW